jgi:hypothetical protein
MDLVGASVDEVLGAGATEVRFRRVLAEANCHMNPDVCCWPQPSPTCEFAKTTFCANHIRRSVAADALGSTTEKCLQESRVADALGLPRRGRGLLEIGSRGGSRFFVPSGSIRALAADTTWRLLVLSGDSGCGKSVAALLWAWRLAGRWWPAMRAYWFQPWADDAYALLTARHLVVDGLSKDWASKDGVHIRNLRYIIGERYDGQCRTLLTTDMLQPEVEGVVGRRYTDAYRDDVKFVRVNDESLRDPLNRARVAAFDEQGGREDDDGPPASDDA